MRMTKQVAIANLNFIQKSTEYIDSPRARWEETQWQVITPHTRRVVGSPSETNPAKNFLLGMSTAAERYPPPALPLTRDRHGQQTPTLAQWEDCGIEQFFIIEAEVSRVRHQKFT